MVRLFSYLTDKDMFAEYYKKQLAKRLLLQRSASDDAERSMIAKLKLKCGAQFTSKLEGMVTDINLSQDIQTAFSEWMEAKALKLEVDLSVQVLTTGFWPTYKSDELNLPSELVACVSAFKEYYDTRTSHRRLRWVHNLGSAQLVGNFLPGGKKKQHDLLLSTYQACILLLFNSQDTYSCADVQAALKLPLDDLKRYLLSLCVGKYRLLLKSPAGKEVEPTDTFKANLEFTDRARRIKVPMLNARVTQEEKETTRQTVDEVSPDAPRGRRAQPRAQLSGQRAHPQYLLPATPLPPRLRLAGPQARDRGGAGADHEDAQVARPPKVRRPPAHAAPAPPAAARALLLPWRAAAAAVARSFKSRAARRTALGRTARSPLTAAASAPRAPAPPSARQAGARGVAAADAPLQARPQADQEAHRGPHRARVPRARRDQEQRVPLPRLSRARRRPSCCA